MWCMNRHFVALSFAAIMAAVSLSGSRSARAQMPSMPGMSDMGQGMMGTMGLPSVSSAGSSNLVGLLGYCVQNNFLGASTASPVMSALGQKAGISGQGDSAYQAGQRGLLDTGNGKSFSLASAGQGVKQQVTQKVCNMVLSRSQSLL
ncbi:YjjA family protein [Gluconacetobacter tumulicola]|uniref:YjjA family protein n=2 Tax=Gluconacetobacter tumulicola TaxID=1017177 RepID=A0A7W4JDV7_9PROT|nr:YjjA family protein [Gluconacetobacter tumulicola]